MSIQQAQIDQIDNIVAFLNASAKTKRGYAPLTSQDLLTILKRDNEYGLPGLLIYERGKEIAGATHVFLDERCAYIAYIVAKDSCTDIMQDLLLAAEKHAHSASTFYVGSPETPLYHTVEGRFQPMWGSTELLEVDSTDAIMQKVLESNGYSVAETHETLVLDLCKEVFEQVPINLCTEHLRGDDCWYNGYNWYGRSSAEEFGLRNMELRVVLLRKSNLVLGHVAWYPLRSKYVAGLCDLEVIQSHRGQGLGRWLLREGLAMMQAEGFRRVELHTEPSSSAVACHLYDTFGFNVDATWYVYKKHARRYRNKK